MPTNYQRRKRQGFMIYHDDAKLLSFLDIDQLQAIFLGLLRLSSELADDEVISPIPSNLDGMARHIYDTMAQKVIRDHDAYQRTCERRRGRKEVLPEDRGAKGDLSLLKEAKEGLRRKKDSNSNSNSNSSSPYTPFMDEAEAVSIQADHNEVLDAAQRVGLGETEHERDEIIGLMGKHGKPAVLSALKECGEHKGRSIAYLRAVLAGGKRGQEEKISWNWL